MEPPNQPHRLKPGGENTSLASKLPPAGMGRRRESAFGYPAPAPQRDITSTCFYWLGRYLCSAEHVSARPASSECLALKRCPNQGKRRFVRCVVHLVIRR